MFIGYYELDGKENFGLYYTGKKAIPYNAGWDLWHRETFSPECENIDILELKTHGKNYQERKNNLENIAIIWQYDWAGLSWSYSELAEISDFFYTNAKRYGLLKVFNENGIC